MTKKLLLSFIIFFSITANSIAELQEILINPDNEAYTRISSGLAGSNITIINSDEIKKTLIKIYLKYLSLTLGLRFVVFMME